MPHRARITAPYLDGTVVELVNQNGGGFVAAGSIDRALAGDDTFALPSDTSIVYPGSPAHVLRLRITLPEARIVDRIALEGISQTSGLTYTVDYGDGVTMTETESGNIDQAGDYGTANALIRFSTPRTATTFDVDITGMTGIFSMTGLAIGGEFWLPPYNFVYGAGYGDAPQSQSVRAGGSNHLVDENKTRSRQLPFEDFPAASYKALNSMIRNKLVRGYCIFEQDQTTTDDWFLARIQMGQVTPTYFQAFNMSVDVLEKDEWL